MTTPDLSVLPFGNAQRRYLIGDHVYCRIGGPPQRGIVADDPAADGRYPIRVLTGEVLVRPADLCHEPEPVPNTADGQIWVDGDGETFFITGPADGWTADGLARVWLADANGRLLPLEWGGYHGTRHNLDEDGWHLYEGMAADQLRAGDQVIGILDPDTGVCLDLLDEELEAAKAVSYVQPGIGTTAVWFTDRTTRDYAGTARLAVLDTGGSEEAAADAWQTLAEILGT